MKEKKEMENYIVNEKIDLEIIVDYYTPYLRTIIQNSVSNNLDEEEIILDTFFYYEKDIKKIIA